MLRLIALLLLLWKIKILILRVREVRWRSWLEWTTEKKLGRKQGSELHVESGTRCLQVILAMLLGHCLRIYRRNVCTSRMPISISSHRDLI
jgi:hypothetical protein